jgi:hypothetical protein
MFSDEQANGGDGGVMQPDGSATPTFGSTYSVTGTIATSGGTPVSGVTVTLTSTASVPPPVTTDGSGFYTLSGLANGSYTVTPMLSGYTFATTRSNPVTINGANVIGFDFIATPTSVPTYSISGKIATSGGTAVSGVTVTLTSTNAVPAPVISDSSGAYTFSGLANGSYTVTPTLTRYTFISQLTQPVMVNGAYITGANFTATLHTYSISGKVAGAAGVTMTLSGGASKTTTADGAGYYSFTNLNDGLSYSVTPSLAHYSFTYTGSASQPIKLNGADVTDVNYTAKKDQVQLTVTTTAYAGGAGTVSSSPSGINISGVSRASASFDYGSTVTLTASPSSSLLRWGGSCTGTSNTCTLTLSANTAATILYSGANYMFVTSTALAVNPTRAQATAECVARAAAAGLPGTYVAWLPDNTTTAEAGLGSARGWIRPDGLPFADSLTALNNGQVFYPPVLDENKQSVGAAYVLTGTKADGSTGMNCWSDSSKNAVVGRASQGSVGWTESGVTLCSNFHVYCFGVDLANPVSITAASGRKAFVSKAYFQLNGIGAADGICASEASAASLSGSFKALLATTSGTALSRFDDTAGSPWVRTDGIPLVNQVGDIASWNFASALTTHADGTYLQASDSHFTWIGAHGLTATATSATTCSDWSVNNSTTTGGTTVSSADSVYYSWDMLCSLTYSKFNLYCLQE